MDEFELGAIIGERRLSLPDGQMVTIVMGTPQKNVDHYSYFCPYKIIGFGDERLSRAAGADAIHSLQSALQKIGIDLYVLNLAHNGTLRWEAGEEGDLGFPLPDNLLKILKS
jgi:hypothetical protein